MFLRVSQWEREIIGQRTKEAMSYLKERRKMYSRPVFGYDNKRGTLRANEQEQAIIEQAQAWRAGGLSYRDIAALLNEQGTPTKRGRTWAAMTVHKLIRRGAQA